MHLHGDGGAARGMVSQYMGQPLHGQPVRVNPIHGQPYAFSQLVPGQPVAEAVTEVGAGLSYGLAIRRLARRRPQFTSDDS